MHAQCCSGERAACRLARQFSGAAASMGPGALLLLFPKCPLCLAAWLTATTGVAVSAGEVTQLRGAVVLLWLEVVAIFVFRLLSRRRRSYSRGV